MSNSFEFNQQIVLVIGGGRGLGRDVVRAFFTRRRQSGYKLQPEQRVCRETYRRSFTTSTAGESRRC